MLYCFFSKMFFIYILTSVDHVTITLTLPRGVGLGLGLAARLASEPAHLARWVPLLPNGSAQGDWILQSINKAQVLEGDFESSFTLKNNPKLTKNHVRRPVSRRGSGCAPVIVALDWSKPQGPCALFAEKKDLSHCDEELRAPGRIEKLKPYLR